MRIGLIIEPEKAPTFQNQGKKEFTGKSRQGVKLKTNGINCLLNCCQFEFILCSAGDHLNNTEFFKGKFI